MRVDDNNEAVIIVMGDKIQQSIPGDVCILRVIEEFHIRPELENADRLSNDPADLIPGGLIREIGSKDQRVFCLWELLHETF